MFGLSKEELSIFEKLSTPIKIQDFLDSFPINWEKKGDTYMSPRRVLQEKKMHCLEGALFAAVALWLHGEPPLLLDLRAEDDVDHVIALYKRNGLWGALSKSNHATLRFRDPIYKTIREIAISYFHEYFNDQTGKKGLRAYSTRPFNLRTMGTKWITSPEDLHQIVEKIDFAPHTKLFPSRNIKYLRKADSMEKKAGKIIEWKRNHPRT